MMIILKYPHFNDFPLQSRDHAIQKRNSHAKTVVAFRNCGCVTSTMIAVMIPMNQHTCVASVIVPPAGNAVQDNPTIVAFQNGCSVMAKMIAVTIGMI